MCKINCSGGCKECDPESHIPSLEEALKVAREALEYYRDECSGNEPSVSVFHRRLDEALSTIDKVLK